MRLSLHAAFPSAPKIAAFAVRPHDDRGRGSFSRSVCDFVALEGTLMPADQSIMRFRRTIFGFLLAVLTVSGVAAQAPAALNPGFDAFRLGMSLNELKEALKNNTFFLYSGDPDVTLLNRPNTNLIDVPGVSFLSRGVFQVVDGKLYSISLELNPEKVSYFDIYTQLTKKYGDPTALDPSSARWENATVRMSLEKPLTVKYIDMPVFQRIQKEGRAQQALEALTRDQFLGTF
jgi:hypothetical protein